SASPAAAPSAPRSGAPPAGRPRPRRRPCRRGRRDPLTLAYEAALRGVQEIEYPLHLGALSGLRFELAPDFLLAEPAAVNRLVGALERVDAPCRQAAPPQSHAVDA